MERERCPTCGKPRVGYETYYCPDKFHSAADKCPTCDERIHCRDPWHDAPQPAPYCGTPGCTGKHTHVPGPAAVESPAKAQGFDLSIDAVRVDHMAMCGACEIGSDCFQLLVAEARAAGVSEWVDKVKALIAHEEDIAAQWEKQLLAGDKDAMAAFNMCQLRISGMKETIESQSREEAER